MQTLGFLTDGKLALVLECIVISLLTNHPTGTELDRRALLQRFFFSSMLSKREIESNFLRDFESSFLGDSESLFQGEIGSFTKAKMGVRRSLLTYSCAF